MKKFSQLPFRERPDLSPHLIHLTKRRNGSSGFKNLVDILKTGVIKGRDASGYIKGGNTAACFLDLPFTSLK
jgi:hypothetical protein